MFFSRNKKANIIPQPVSFVLSDENFTIDDGTILQFNKPNKNPHVLFCALLHTLKMSTSIHILTLREFK